LGVRFPPGLPSAGIRYQRSGIRGQVSDSDPGSGGKSIGLQRIEAGPTTGIREIGSNLERGSCRATENADAN
jgi:hypothetical protein